MEEDDFIRGHENAINNPLTGKWSHETLKMKCYFAYGSNMSETQMATRAKDAVKDAVVELPGYEFILDTRGFASIAKHGSRSVWGVLYKISESDEAALDKYEGVRDGYYRKADLPEIGCDLVYISMSNRADHPKEGRKGYMTGIIQAAIQEGFPDRYIAELRSWSLEENG